MIGIKDEVIIITGASSGIGKAAALLLAECGAKLVPGARRTERLVTLGERICNSGGAVVVLAADVAKRGAVSQLVALALERYGKLKVMVSNVGIGPISPLDDLRVENWESRVDINIKGVP